MGAYEAVRQGQQNRRGRGRNRKSQNPLSRSFESNGPDVKIRGTPAHIAEKYLSLARDAQSSGDPVLAENYLQHAEHYSRIIMAYREQMHQPGDLNGNGQRLRMGGPGEGPDGEEFGIEEDGEDLPDEGFPQPLPQPQGQGHPQGRHHGYEGNHRQDRHDRPYRRDHGRYRDRDRRNDRDRQGDNRPQSVERQPELAAESGGEPRRREPMQQVHEQPEFLRRPVRRRSEGDDAAPPRKDEPSGD
jgi:hypothetical protein